MHALRPALQSYDWGSPTLLPAFLGVPPTGRPVAEAWWGTHAAGPAICTVEGREVPLDEFIAADPQGTLGPDIARVFEGKLPFLLKVLAIETPLSIQVHPSIEEARVGFAREEASGIPRDSAIRVFKDENHKPEMVVALSPMLLLAGFRPAALTRRDVMRLKHPDAPRLASALEGADQGAAIAEYVELALTGVDTPALVSEVVRVADEPGAGPSLLAAAAAAEHYPADGGVLVALAMNVVNLEPGEACFTPDGIVHSYQRGLGLEIMANSDNVIRAGLTPKHIDLDTLFEVANMAPSAPVRPDAERDEDATMLWPKAEEFLLTLVKRGPSTFLAHPRIVLALEGTTMVASDEETRELAAGEAVFVPFSDGDIAVATSGLAAVAGAPLGDSDSRLGRKTAEVK